ncbi:MAG: hypothetical protein K8R74_15620 [Bacteroidales bacterium]|nr:hypothetical protein [Bacteroidales bacterium]
MRYLFPLILFAFCALGFSGQTQTARSEGKISYITSQSVYVKFESTKNVYSGDTLYFKQEGNLIPILIVKNLSSISCVCTSISAQNLKVSDVIFTKEKPVNFPAAVIVATTLDTISLPVEEADSIPEETTEQKALKQEINGRLSIASYSNFSNSPASNSQRMRYTFSLKANNISDSRLSAEAYISFVHSNKNWDEVKSNIFNGLKVYNLALKYDFNETTHLLLGRKINPKLSSVGAIDGLQFEKKFKSFSVGAFAGSRPDYNDYSINLNLFQYGIYTGHDHKAKNGFMQSALGFIEQNNNSKTDRRFLYFQHINSLIKNLYFFGSAEMDLYKVVNGQTENTFNLTNLYLSLRYRVIRQLSLALSYSARQNIIYYETYKDFVERLLESETLQGWRFQINYRPIKNSSLGVNTGYRFRADDPKASKNLYGYLTYSHVPGLNAAVTLSATLLETSYISGNIYSLGITRDLVPGKLNGGLKYRYVDYLYTNSETSQIQNIGEANITWRIYKKLSL